MVKGKKTDLEAVVKKAKADKIADEEKAAEDAKSLKNPISPLKEFGVEPVIGIKNKGKKPRGAAKNVKQKPKEKPPGKTDARTIKKGEEKTPVGEETPLPIRPRRRTFFDWFLDGGKG